MAGNIGGNIRKFRKQAGMTQIELAKAVDVTEKTIVFWEKNKTGPTAPFIHKLCEVLHCTEAEILGGATPQRFELILDPDDNFGMEVVNMTDTAVEQKTIVVSPRRIGLNLNLNTVGMSKKAARELMLATFDEIFNDAWNQQVKWQKRGAEA